MRSRRHYNNDAVYWPAFADIMTVLVVVLLCTFAVMKPPSPPPCPECEKKACAGDSPLPGKTLEQYRADVLVAQRRCVLNEFQTDIANTLNDSFQSRLCRFIPGSKRSDSPNECLTALQKIDESFTHAPSFESLESRYSIRFVKLYLRANTGLGSIDADTLKKYLKEGQDYLETLTTGPFASLGLQNPEYTEKGPANWPSEMTFGINTDLSPVLSNRINRVWKDVDAEALKDILNKSNSCERIGS